jgi:hypothetical protein
VTPDSFDAGTVDIPSSCRIVGTGAIFQQNARFFQMLGNGMPSSAKWNLLGYAFLP